MGTRIKLYSLFFLILNIYTRFTAGISLTKDDLTRTVYITDDDFVTEDYQEINQNHNACTYDNGKDPNIRKDIEEIIKVLVKDSLPPVIETPTEQEDDIARDIQDAANKIIVQLALHASKITQKILQSLEKPNDTQAAVDTELQHCALIENKNRMKEVQEIADKVSLLSKNTKELTDTITLNNKQQRESLENMDKKITVLEKLTSSDSHNIRDVLAYTGNIQKSVKNHSELEILSQIREENDTKINSLCEVKVPDSIVTNHDIWKDNLVPEMDDLDTYMINKTGCSYIAVKNEKGFYLPKVTFDGSLLEWRMAVRTQRDTDIGLTWDSWNRKGFSFFVGINENTVSRLTRWEDWNKWEHSTPVLLSEDRYVPFYLKIYNGTLSVGHECSSKPFATVKLSLTKGQVLGRLLNSRSPYGAKFLYNCPPNFTG